MRNEAFRWFEEASWDLDTVKILHKERRYNAAAFYSHQAAEKACKALLYNVNEAPWGIALELLARYFNRIEEKPLEELMKCARELDRHYIPSR
ncbi:MAG: HEPN domain-containing protein [Candidatus Bathyarchaeia archaeon]